MLWAQSCKLEILEKILEQRKSSLRAGDAVPWITETLADKEKLKTSRS